MMTDDNDRLNDALALEPTPLDPHFNEPPEKQVGEAASPMATYADKGQYTQWSLMPNEMFFPAGPGQARLTAGVYEPSHCDRGIYFQKRRLVTDDLIELDNTASRRVLEGMRLFWGSKPRYVERGIIYKRGILLWGPAGSGKSATIALLVKELIALDGLVMICSNPALTADALALLRRIEPDRNLILILEDIDELIRKHGEHQILSLLDGETQIDNVVNLATTNFPEMLGARIVNRPSRFDDRILIDMPSEAARTKYLKHATAKDGISEAELRIWVRDTEGFSVAHLRELVVAVFILQQEYNDVLTRLRKMRVQLKSKPEFATVAGFQEH